MMVRDTFERNPGLCELFKRKILDKAQRVGFNAEFIDFDSFIDMKCTYSENLAIFHREYPQLADKPITLKIPQVSQVQIERSYRAYQINNGEIPEPIAPIIAVANTGETFTEPKPSQSPSQPFPILSFSFNYSSSLLSEPKPQVKEQSAKPELKPARTVTLLDSRFAEIARLPRHFLIVGKKDEGKSALGYNILERHKGTRPCFVYRPPKPALLPSWILPIECLGDLPNNAICLIDEAPNEFDQYSYRKLSSRRLAEMLRLSRHKHQSIILVAQSSTSVSQNLMFPIDIYLLKEPSMFQRVSERRIVRQAYERIPKRIEVNEFYWFDSELFTKGAFEKPDFYTEELSKTYSEYGQAHTHIEESGEALVPIPLAANPCIHAKIKRGIGFFCGNLAYEWRKAGKGTDF